MKKLLAVTAVVFVFLGLFVVFWQFTQPLDTLNKISFYNRIFPGRNRLPFGESPQTAYNFSIGSLDAAFASHEISRVGEKESQMIRVITIGDSSSWGTLLQPGETLCGQLNGRELSDGRVVKCYNLAYPTLSLAKDYMILNRALEYDPDLIIWPMTLESFPNDKQTSNELIQANWAEYCKLFSENSNECQDKMTIEKSIWGQRRDAADWIRLQLYGLMWAGTGIDQDYPAEYPVPQIDLSDDNSYHGITGSLPDDALSWDILQKGMEISEPVPVILINEPMLISDGENSKIRYNYYYPREAYDSWHQKLLDLAEENEWCLLDMWDSLDVSDFTNSAIHYNAESAHYLADIVFAEIEKIFL